MLGGQSQFLEDTQYGAADGLLMRVERSRILRAARRPYLLRRRQQGLDRLISEDHERGHGSESFRKRFVTARFADAPHDVLAPEFLQIVSSSSRIIL